jgi:predicted DNA-binding transcriptional regulator AlpA
MQKTTDKQVLTATEVAAILRVSTKTLTKWVRDGKFPRQCVPGRWSWQQVSEILGSSGKSREPQQF